MNTDQKLEAMIAATRDWAWPGSLRNTTIEEFLMKESKRKGRGVRAGILWGVGVLLTGGAVLGATRLYERYHVRLTVNGVESEHTVEAGPDGTALMEVEMPGGGHARVLVGAENVGPDGQIHVGLWAEDGGDKNSNNRSATAGRTVPEGPLQGAEPRGK